MSSSVVKPRAKPWETQASHDAIIPSGELQENISSTTNTDAGAGAPDLPQKPASLGSENSNTIRSSLGNAGSFPGIGSGPYGSPYGGSLYGAGLGSMYGGAGGYGSMYGGGYGSMYGGGYGSMMGGGYGVGNMYGANNGAQNLAESTQATFQLIEGLIGAVAGFAQMLEATYMATHNSFFTMVSMAEQISSLKEMLGSFFGIFAAMKMLKRLLYRASNGRLGLPPSKTNSQGAKSKIVQEFERFGEAGEREKRKRRMSWKPLLIFLAAVFGFPFLLRKFIAKLSEIQQRKLGNTAPHATNGSLDPRSLEFARAIYDFTPENPQIELTLKKGDLMAVISKQDPMGNPSEWWRVRTKKGDIGYVPYNYLELIKRQKRIETAADTDTT